MSQRHPIQNDCCMLVTINCAQRTEYFINDAFASTAIESLYETQTLYPFFLFGFVIMPDHCHLLMRVPACGSISKIIGSFKRRTSFHIGHSIWQPRFHLKIINNPEKALEYIYMNPVQTHIVHQSSDYPWSSANGKWDLTSLSN